MKNRVVITRITYKNIPLLAFVVMDSDRNWIDLKIFNEKEQSLINQIYVGKVSNIVKNINSAFIQIGKEQKCFLPLEEVKKPIYTMKPSKSEDLCIGDELLVQITKDAVKTKDPVCSTNLVMHGKYCFLSTENKKHGVSKKLDTEARTRLLNILDECVPIENLPYGIVFRTNAKEASDSDLKEDLLSLTKQYDALVSTSLHRSLYSKVYDFDKQAISAVKEISFEEIDQIITDQEDLYQDLISYFHKNSSQITLYHDQAISLQTLYGFKRNLDELASNKVWLKSGGNIIIESLETLTAIDINSGKAIDKSKDFILKLNKEAAKEIARQLRLRSISGMIIIDFVNMQTEYEKEELIKCLKDEIKKDHVSCNFIDITKLGLVELTRKKVQRSLAETLTSMK